MTTFTGSSQRLAAPTFTLVGFAQRLAGFLRDLVAPAKP
jgi:hypothetical protein